MIWFDDGLRSTYNVAYPVMRRHGLKGIVAVITSRVGKTYEPVKLPPRPCLTVKQLKTLIEGGWEIASHTVTHPFRFDKLTLDQTSLELEESKNWIIKNLDVNPTKFVVPRHLIREDQRELAMKFYSYIRPLPIRINLYPEDHLVFHWIDSRTFEKGLLREMRKWSR